MNQGDKRWRAKTRHEVINASNRKVSMSVKWYGNLVAWLSPEYKINYLLSKQLVKQSMVKTISCFSATVMFQLQPLIHKKKPITDLV